MFENIYGFNKVKDELITMIDWFINRDEYKKLDVVIPKGIILYGPPGCGKTLFMKEIKNKYGSNVRIVNGDSKRPIEEIGDAFDTSVKIDFEIILIDELDLLLRDDNRLVRKLQTCMDGLNMYDNVLVIATANKLHEINDPLLRPGRFDRTLSLGRPSKNDRYEILKNLLSKKDINLSDMDIKFLTDLVNGSSCADIVALINDSILRNNGKQLSLEMIEKSYNLSFSAIPFCKGQKMNEYVAMHEAGHALIIYKNKDYYMFYRACIDNEDGSRGKCKVFEVDENDSSLEKEIADIEIKIGGYLANKIVNNYIDSGSGLDLTGAVFHERVLVNSLGYKGINHVLRRYEEHSRNETERTCYKNEVIVRRDLKKIVKRVSIYIRKNKTKLIHISNLLQEKGIVDRFEFEEIMKGA